MTRVVLLGDGRWASDALTALANSGYDVLLAVGRGTPSTSDLSDSAERLGISYLQPPGPSSADLETAIIHASPHVLLSIAYDRIIPRRLLRLPSHGSLNVHAGLLPRYRGCSVISWAIINGETSVGLTVHYMDEHLDSGPILIQRELPFGSEEGYGDVLCRVIKEVPDAVLQALPLAMTGHPGRIQNSLAATYFPRRRNGDEGVNWRSGSVELHNFVRGVTRPGPGARTWTEDGQELRIWRTRHDSRLPAYRSVPGVVLKRGAGKSVLVTTGDGVLELLDVEVVGSHCMGLAPGTRFKSHTP